MTPKTAEDRLRYAKQFGYLIHNQFAAKQLLQLSPNKRIHVQKALSCLARYTGHVHAWRQIREQYQLSWSTGTEKLDAFTRFFDSSKDLDTMIEWLRKALASLPAQYSRFILFCTLTGLRSTECLEAVKLLNKRELLPAQYYNPEQMILQHYRFPDIFIRRTKAVYISIASESIIAIARGIGKTPTLNGLKMAIRHSYLSMQLKYCRKIYASWLHKCGISDSLIDMLQGRIGKNIFLRHYLTPSSDYKIKVLQALEHLQRQLY
jgi:intergrase/recombinase